MLASHAPILQPCAYFISCRYPHSLFFLEQLQDKAFRQNMAQPDFQVRLWSPKTLV